MPKQSDVLSKFKFDSLKDTYEVKIREKCTTGIDRINRDSFELRLEEYLSVIERKVADGSYTFTPYKQKLISKGPNKYPRVISIPTIRDKITLKTMQEILSSRFNEQISRELIHVTIQRVKDAISSCQYDYFLKFDIKDFYPSIDHRLLLRKVRKELKNRRVNVLVSAAIKTPTMSLSSDKKANNKGVPQGLSISNILADIYLIDLDKSHGVAEDYQYFRYVDDILLLCKKERAVQIESTIVRDFKEVKLKINTDKTTKGSLKESFAFLGYEWNGYKFTVRPSSKFKLENSLLKTFTEYKYSRLDIPSFLWRLNLRITGCKYNDKKYGWLFFFSQIDDFSLLYHFDHLISKWLEQYEINIDRNLIKRYVRVYHEIRLNLNGTKYIPDFDNQTTEQKRVILQKYFDIKSKGLSDHDVEQLYRKRISWVVRDLDKDVQGFS